MGPLVSVIVPIHNGERYLRETLESILGQTYRPLEVIAVDDGSADSSAAIAQSFGSEVTYLHKAQQGHPAARNDGVRASRGDFLTFLDHDDLWMPNKLELQMNHINCDPSCELVFAHMQNFFSPEMPPEARARVLVPLQPLPGLLQGSMLVRREIFLKIGFFFEGRGTGDFLEWYGRALALRLKSHMLPETLVRRRIHDANYMRLNQHERQDYVRALKEVLDRRRATSAVTAP